MRGVEWALAGLLALFGVRSLVYWVRRPLDARSLRDHLLYAVFITGRVGVWFAIAGIFVISALIGGAGKPFLDEFAEVRWYIFVPLGLAAMQLLAGVALGRGR